MKKIMAFVLVSFIGLSIFGSKSGEAYPGAMCFNTEGCNSKCEVCVKAKQFDPSGTCMKIAGCY